LYNEIFYGLYFYSLIELALATDVAGLAQGLSGPRQFNFYEYFIHDL